MQTLGHSSPWTDKTVSVPLFHPLVLKECGVQLSAAAIGWENWMRDRGFFFRKRRAKPPISSSSTCLMDQGSHKLYGTVIVSTKWMRNHSGLNTVIHTACQIRYCYSTILVPSSHLAASSHALKFHFCTLLCHCWFLSGREKIAHYIKTWKYNFTPKDSARLRLLKDILFFKKLLDIGRDI